MKLRRVKTEIMNLPYYIRRTWNRTQIRNKDFTVIANNCWAGKLYQYLGMEYLTPTVGLYFFAEDYLKFVSNLKYYLSLDLKIISAKSSKHIGMLKWRNHTEVPIGKLNDIEIVFLHYKSGEEAKEKWNRRKARVNYNNLYIKNSKMNLCSEDEMRQFAELPFDNKFFLNNRKEKKYECEVYWSGPGDEKEILSDTVNFPGNLKLTSLLKRKGIGYPEEGLRNEKVI